jgi:hypothetical protein
MDPTLAAILAARLGVDPGAIRDGSGLRRMLLEKLLAEQPAAGPPAEPAQPPPSPRQPPPAAAAELLRLRRTAQHLAALVRFIGETFAACATCWGTRADCPRCGGRGGPGTQPVDPAREADFLAWIEPNLAARGLVVRRAEPQRAPPAGVAATES